MNNYNAIPLELRNLPNCCGIYMILNAANNKFYIGSSIRLKRRLCEHARKLNNNTHSNKHLQSAWNKDGADFFDFIILEIIDNKDNVVKMEQKWIDELRPHYNFNPFATTNLGIKFSDEIKAKMSASARIKVFTKEHRLNMSLAQKGRKHPAETKLKMSLSARKPKSDQQKINNGLAKRDFIKWPHKKGNRCDCIECKLKTNQNARVQYAKRTLKNVS